MSPRPRYGPVRIRELHGLRIAIAEHSAGPAIHVLDGETIATIVLGPGGQTRQVLDVPAEIAAEIGHKYFPESAEPPDLQSKRSPLAL